MRRIKRTSPLKLPVRASRLIVEGTGVGVVQNKTPGHRKRDGERRRIRARVIGCGCESDTRNSCSSRQENHRIQAKIGQANRPTGPKEKKEVSKM